MKSVITWGNAWDFLKRNTSSETATGGVISYEEVPAVPLWDHVKSTHDTEFSYKIDLYIFTYFLLQRGNCKKGTSKNIGENGGGKPNFYNLTN